jgi:hypothetical protein
VHNERQIGTTYSKFVLESRRATVFHIQIYGRNHNLEWSILQRKQHHLTVVHFQYGVSSRCKSPFGITIRFRASFDPLSSREKPTEIVRVEETSAKGGSEKSYLERASKREKEGERERKREKERERESDQQVYY